MRSALLDAPGQVVVKDLPVPALQGGDLLVDMKACGICGSDLEKIRGGYTAAPPVLGHEAVGVVREAGEGIEGIREGDRVFPHHHVPCYACDFCHAGSETMCADYRRWHLEPGGFAEAFRVPAWNVQKGGVLTLPTSLSFEEATFIEPLACCIRALDRFRVPKGATVLVSGAGPMGLLTLQLLPFYGAEDVLVSEVSSYRSRAARRLGALTVDPGEGDLGKVVRKESGGRGADLAVVASSNPKALLQALDSTRDGGTVGLLGIPEAGASLPEVSRLLTRELSLISSNAATERETRRAVEMLAEGAIDAASLVTHRVGLAEIAKGLALAQNAKALKVVVTP
ncbi:MAG: alcohol dehydrogenase catalytic domain-containing protein [Thermoplasmata archaeon]